MKISIVIPNYNGSELIRNNLPKVLDSVFSYEYEIIIVDDFSDQIDFSNLKKYLESLSNDKITLLRNNDNLGFASTINRGINESQFEFVVLLNSDVAPSKNFLKMPIEDLNSNQNLFGVGFMDESVERDKVVLRGRGLASWNRGFLVHKRGEVDKQNTFWISGGSSIIRKSIFKKLSEFDEILNPFYWEDIDLSYRAQKAGYDIMFEKGAVVRHHHLKGAIKTHYTDSEVKKIAYRNQIIFVWKNITDSKLLLSHILWMPYHLIRAALSTDFNFISAFFIAVTKLPAIIGKRRKQSKTYVKLDREIITL